MMSYFQTVKSLLLDQENLNTSTFLKVLSLPKLYGVGVPILKESF